MREGAFQLIDPGCGLLQASTRGAVSHRRQGGSDGLLCVRRADGGAWVHDEFALFCSRRQNKADLFFSPSLVLSVSPGRSASRPAVSVSRKTFSLPFKAFTRQGG